MNRTTLRIFSTRLGHVLAGLILTFGSAPQALADDTELFVADIGRSALTARPNIVFIIDSSGSMDSDALTQPPWDPTATWTGSFDPTRYYFSKNSIKPDPASDQWFHKANFHCDAAIQAIAAIGQYKARFLSWKGAVQAGSGKPYEWVPLTKAPQGENRPVECQDDEGVHGANAADPNTYAADGQGVGPWSTASNVVWNNTYTIYDGNWLNWNASPATFQSNRIEVVKTVASDLLWGISNVNVGLMRFNRDEGGPVIHEAVDVDANRASLLATVDSLTADGFTPLSETLYEAGRYFGGLSVDYGDEGPILSVPNSRNGNDYQSPVEFACQKNFVVLLTDGEPTRDDSADSKIENLPNFDTLVGNQCDGSGNGHCLDDLAEYLFKHDLDDNLPGLQNIITYTVGFSVDLDLLDDTARRGGGKYELADDTSLAATLTEIVLSILDDATSFTAPSVPVNAFNRTKNLDDVYVSVFEPARRLHWPGNLKKYRFVDGVLTGQDGNAAVDPDTGFFDADTAFSFWSDPPADGDRVREGGAAHEQPAYASRKLYTNISGGVLTSAGNAVHTGNANITAAAIGAAGADRDNLINWARGLDLLDEDDDGDVTDDRHVMGDPLHVRPVTVIYGGTESNPDGVVFTATNDGYLHAIDMRTGGEDWAFIPARLLSRLNGLYLNDLNADKSFGLDGEFTPFILNDDRMPGIDTSAGEKAYLIFGMRRGGRALFALDVTDRNSPEVLWEIDPTTNGGDFADMGQSWSRAKVTKIRLNDVERNVVIFGGGYDEGQDVSGFRTDNEGNAVYMVDLETGSLVWSAGLGTQHDLNLNMQHSIPAPVNVIDLSGNGFANRMYVGDMGGRIWRFDIDNAATSVADLVDGGMLATLGGADVGTPLPADVRRFYGEVDVVPVISETHASFLTVNVGSGHRAHPVETQTEDYFFSVRDFNMFNRLDSADPAYSTPTIISELVDITDDVSPALTAADNGWRLRMELSAGEKVVTPSTTLKGTIFFSSFSPSSQTSICDTEFGVNRLYRVNVRDGSPTPNRDTIADPNAPLDKEDRYEQLKQGGIAPGPVLFFTDDDEEGAPDLCVGVACEDSGIFSGYEETFWFQDETQ